MENIMRGVGHDNPQMTDTDLERIKALIASEESKRAEADAQEQIKIETEEALAPVYEAHEKYHAAVSEATLTETQRANKTLNTLERSPILQETKDGFMARIDRNAESLNKIGWNVFERKTSY